MRRLVLLLLAAAPLGAQVIDIGFPLPSLIVGQEERATAIARSPTGEKLAVDKFNWSASDASVLTVDAEGKVTAVGIGTARIKASSALTGGVFSELELPVYPARLEVTPASKELFVGESATFRAAAFDIRDKPIPAPFEWALTGQNGRETNVAAISPAGVLKATAAGQVTVRALIPYTPRDGKPPRVEALAAVAVRTRPEYRLARLVSNDSSRDSFALRPSPGAFTANDAGQLAFTASLDALSTGVLLYSNGAFRLLANTGAPSPFPGGVIARFQSVSLNAKGQALISVPAGAARRDGGLMLSSGDSTNFVLLDGAAFGDRILDISFIYITSNSLNDNGDFVFRALYREPDAEFRDGLFRFSNGSAELIWDENRPLPGIAGKLNFILDSTGEQPGWSGNNGFGIDNQGTVYFIAHQDSGSARGLFRAPVGAATPTRILALGDTFLRSTVKVLTDVIVLPNGDVVMRIDLNNGEQHVVRYSAGRFENIQIRNSQTFRVLAANTRGAVLFAGNALGAAGKGEGLYLWGGGTSMTNVLLLTPPNRYVESAAITTAGQIYAVLRTDTNDFVVQQPGAARPILFQAGTIMNVSANLHITGLIRGTRAALPYLRLGDPSSIFEIQAQGGSSWTLAPKLQQGDRLGSAAATAGFGGVTAAFEDGSGNLQFDARGALYRLSGGTLTQLLGRSSTATDRVNLFTPKPWAVNGRGVQVIETNTDQGHRRLYLLNNGNLTLLMRSGTKSPYDGGTVIDWTQVAIDDQNRVMAYFVVTGGGNGYFLYSGGTWQAAGFMQAMRIPLFGTPQLAVAAADLRTAGGKFYARFSLREEYADSAVAEFVSFNNWKAAVTSGDTLPTGSAIGYIDSFDVNANGKVLFTAVVPVTGSRVLGVRAADGIHIVFLNSDVTDSGDYLLRFGDVNIREDDRILFSAFDVHDRNLVFQALAADRPPFDLAVKIRDVTPTTVGAGDAVTVRYSVSEADGVSGRFSTSVRISAAQSITPANTPISSGSFDIVKGAADLSAVGVIPRNLAAGRYYIAAIVQTAGDANPANNTSEILPLTVTATRAPFDIGVGAITATPAVIAPGRTFSVTAEIRNTSKSTGSYQLSVYLSADQTIKPSDQLLATFNFSLAGEGRSLTASPVTLPASAALGRAFIRLTLESQGDTNPADNTSAAFPIQVGTAP
jgi:hypothetical protein